MSANNRIPHRRLRRPWMIQALQRIARKYRNLTYPRFVIVAESEINPQRTTDPDYNFSRIESVIAWVSAIPLRLRDPDIRVYVDQFNRPDLYALRYCDNERTLWNQDPAYWPLFIYKTEYLAVEYILGRGGQQKRQREVYYDYLHTIQGQNEVRQVDAHLAQTIAGLEDRRASVQGALNISEVERVRERVLDEIRGNRRT